MKIALYSRQNLRLLILFILVFTANNAFATHFFGIDLRYSYISGNSYRISMFVYGDCSGQGFPSLPASAPVISVFNGNTLYTNITLSIQPPANGIEVTNVCPSQRNNTQCVNINNPIPGVKMFVYSNIITLPDTSSLWRFQFNGNLTNNTAGRSISLTNVTNPGAVSLIDTLNNAIGSNNSPVLTTIPTPFYCIQEHIQYNPAAIDSNADSLAFFLVPAVDALSGANLSYVSPYTATSPFAAIPGSFSFSGTNGQLNFIPNALQKSLAVYNIEEWRNGHLAGTSQREMTFIILNCSDTASYGPITNASAGTIVDETHFKICQSTGPFTFQINPTNPQNDTISIKSVGLPYGSSYSIVDSNTPHPTGTFSWSTSGVTPGNYIFYLTFEANNCPLTSIQTVAYTVAILKNPVMHCIVNQSHNCQKKSYITVSSTTTTNFTYNLIYDGDIIQTQTSAVGYTLDSVAPGDYTIHVTDTNGCYFDTTVSIRDPLTIRPLVTFSSPLCAYSKDGTIYVDGINSTAIPFKYSINSGQYSTVDSFKDLDQGNYTLSITDTNNCVADTTISLTAPPGLSIDNLTIVQPTCYGLVNGSLAVKGSGGTGTVKYEFNGNDPSNTGVYVDLAAGTYTITLTDSNNCKFDALINVNEPSPLNENPVVNLNPCNGIDSNVGSVTLETDGGTAPYSYLWSTDTGINSNSLRNLSNGIYQAWITDANGCKDSIREVITYDNCCMPFLANAFTPNDDGKDDIYRMKFKGDLQLLEFSIYNRFGQRVFTTNNIDEGWDGTYNGVKQDMDTYFYYCRFICGAKGTKKIALKGDVTLIR